MHEICLKDPRGAQNLGLSVKSTGLDTFYYLNRTSSPRVQVRMISNLKELDLVITTNIKKDSRLLIQNKNMDKIGLKGHLYTY